MSGIDASFLYFETPTSHMHVLGTILVDPSTRDEPWTRSTVTDLLRERIALVPQFRRKLLPSSTRLRHPFWVDVDDVDVESHVGHRRCPAPGGRAELTAIVADFASRKLARNKPLWRVLEVDGLADGRVAVVVKVHHCAVDGVGAAAVLGALFDLDPSGRPAEELEQAWAAAEAERRPHPGLVDRTRHTAHGIVTSPVVLAKVGASGAKAVVGIVKHRRSEDSEGGGAIPFVAPRAAFNGGISASRVVALADVALDDVKAVKNQVGGTVNDAVIALCGGALRRYLLARDELPDSSLIGVVPVSVRGEDDDAGGNQVSAMFTTLATDLADPLDRLDAVRRANNVAKQDQKAVGDSLLSQAAHLGPPSALGGIARAYSALRLADRGPVVHNLVISNVPGPPIPLYLAGGRIEGLYPLGPVLEGNNLNITVISYAGRVGFGFIACKQLMPDLADLAAEVPHALDELLAATR